MEKRRATCSCGALSVECSGAPVRVSVCHCLACQRRTGSAFGVQARYPEDRVTVSGVASTYRRVADSGSGVLFRFCGACGGTTHWTLEALPGFVAVAVGAFAEPEFPPPTVAIYEARQHPWVGLRDVEHFD